MSEKEGEGKSPARKSGRGLGRFITTIFIIALILLGTLILAVRTEGGRSFVQDWLGKKLGMEMIVAGAKISYPFRLTMENVVSKAQDEAGKPVFKAQELTVGLTPRGAWNIAARRAALTIVRNGDSWDPAFFARVGDLASRNLSELSKVMEKFGSEIRFHAADSSVDWFSAPGEPLASAHGISFDVTPIEVPGKKMRHFRLSVYNATGADGVTVNDVEREWLSSETKAYIEIERSGAADSQFWNFDGAGAQAVESLLKEAR